MLPAGGRVFFFRSAVSAAISRAVETGTKARRTTPLMGSPRRGLAGRRSCGRGRKASRRCCELEAESQGREVYLVFTIRNMGGVALFLFGTTFLWLTPSFASPGVSTTGTMWALTAVLALATLVGFMVATWGLFRKASWWEGAAVTAAVLGVVVLIPYWLAARHAGETTPEFNVFIHALGDAGVFILLLVPKLEHWVSGHVIAGH